MTTSTSATRASTSTAPTTATASRSGSASSAIRERVPGRPVARPAARALDRAAAQRPHLRHDARARRIPEAYFADNDLALGRLVEAVSHSPFWPNTAILVTEDDAQNGPDHVDAHRTLAYVISPYTQTGKVDHTHYDTAGMVATVESLLNLPPMTIVDQRATRMWKGFSSTPNFRPYDAQMPKVIPHGDPAAPTNAPTAPLADGVRAVELQGRGRDAGDRAQRGDLEVRQRAPVGHAGAAARLHHRLAARRPERLAASSPVIMAAASFVEGTAALAAALAAAAVLVLREPRSRALAMPVALSWRPAPWR